MNGAALPANLIEKYAVVLNPDALPDLVIDETMPEKDDADKDIHKINIEPAKAACYNYHEIGVQTVIAGALAPAMTEARNRKRQKTSWDDHGGQNPESP